MTIKKIVIFVSLVLALTITTQKVVYSEPSLDNAAQQLLKSQLSPQILENMYIEVSSQMALAFQAKIQPAIQREITDSEKQRLQLFWYNKLKELMPYSVIEEMLLPVFKKHLTYEEMTKINEFYSTPVGRKLIELLPIITRESQAAGEDLARKLGDQEVMNKLIGEMKAQFPQWFPEEE